MTVRMKTWVMLCLALLTTWAQAQDFVGRQEGSYEVKINDGPLRKLGPGDTFYEPPGALHAVSRNGSATEFVKYLVIQVSDPTKPATVKLNQERIDYWLRVGAQPSETVASLLKQAKKAAAKA